jgi:hypothetical protein
MKVRLNKEEPTATQRKALKKEVAKEFNKLLDRYNHDTAIQVLHILHFDFGFGQARLQKFADRLNQMQIDQRERYELTDSDTPWLCEKQLKDDGIDLGELIKE